MRFLWWCVAAFWTAHVIGKPLLNQATVWRLNLQLKKTNYEPLNCILNVRFTLDKGYEPPSGQVYIENDSLGFANTNERGVSGLWTLSEDKNDRKDGLWVWGLFEEPKYPFMYFSLNVWPTIIVNKDGKEEEVQYFGPEGIPNNRLNIRFNHRRKDGAVILDQGELTYSSSERVNADPVGLAKVDISESVLAGTVSILPLT